MLGKTVFSKTYINLRKISESFFYTKKDKKVIGAFFKQRNEKRLQLNSPQHTLIFNNKTTYKDAFAKLITELNRVLFNFNSFGTNP